MKLLPAFLSSWVWVLCVFPLDRVVDRGLKRRCGVSIGKMQPALHISLYVYTEQSLNDDLLPNLIQRSKDGPLWNQIVNQHITCTACTLFQGCVWPGPKWQYPLDKEQDNFPKWTSVVYKFFWLLLTCDWSWSFPHNSRSSLLFPN